LLVWNSFAWWTPERSDVALPYTTFLAQVRAYNVASVHIIGDEIRGVFVKPIDWPPASPTPKKSTSSQTRKDVAPSATPPPAPAPDFHTLFPAVVGDPNLLSLLETHKVEIHVTHPASPWLLELLASWFPLVLLLGFFVWTGQRAAKNQAGMFGFGRTKARQYTSDRPEVTFQDVAGADEAKTDLQGEVKFLRQPQNIMSWAHVFRAGFCSSVRRGRARLCSPARSLEKLACLSLA
jgi:cell division protease FtsH